MVMRGGARGIFRRCGYATHALVRLGQESMVRQGLCSLSPGQARQLQVRCASVQHGKARTYFQKGLGWAKYGQVGRGLVVLGMAERGKVEYSLNQARYGGARSSPACLGQVWWALVW